MKSFQWKCEVCGFTGHCISSESMVSSRSKHYTRLHPEDGRYLRTPRPKVDPGKCGETCDQFTGKKICLSGNVTAQGEFKTCWVRE